MKRMFFCCVQSPFRACLPVGKLDPESISLFCGLDFRICGNNVTNFIISPILFLTFPPRGCWPD
jgi:hypothetical protein